MPFCLTPRGRAFSEGCWFSKHYSARHEWRVSTGWVLRAAVAHMPGRRSSRDPNQSGGGQQRSVSDGQSRRCEGGCTKWRMTRASRRRGALVVATMASMSSLWRGGGAGSPRVTEALSGQFWGCLGGLLTARPRSVGSESWCLVVVMMMVRGAIFSGNGSIWQWNPWVWMGSGRPWPLVHCGGQALTKLTASDPTAFFTPILVFVPVRLLLLTWREKSHERTRRRR